MSYPCPYFHRCRYLHWHLIDSVWVDAEQNYFSVPSNQLCTPKGAVLSHGQYPWPQKVMWSSWSLRMKFFFDDFLCQVKMTTAVHRTWRPHVINSNGHHCHNAVSDILVCTKWSELIQSLQLEFLSSQLYIDVAVVDNEMVCRAFYIRQTSMLNCAELFTVYLLRQ